MKKRWKIVVLAGVLAIFCTACSFGQGGDSETAKLPNPLVKIEDAEEWEEQLGITIDIQYLPGEVEMYILTSANTELAQANFSVQNVNGEEIDCTLRAGRTEEDISGVYGNAEEIIQEYPCGESTIQVTVKDYEADHVQVYQFFYEDVQYVFQYAGTMSTMQLGEILDSIFMAIGAESV